MLIRKKVRDLSAYLRGFGPEEPVYVVLVNPESHNDSLREIGFSVPLVEGEQLLPDGDKGVASRRNAYGDEIIHRDQPMETHHRLREWTWEEFHGRYEKVERSRIVETPYQRYPRTFVPPFAVELRVARNNSGSLVIVAGPLSRDDARQQAVLLNTVHLFIELFGECALVKRDLTFERGVPVRRLNWEILPQGRYPWAQAKPAVARVVSQAKPFDRAVLESRFQEITEYEPDFIALGRSGFSRYVVFGWEEKRLYILESTEVNNATYILKNNWEAVSAMTKAQVLQAEAHHSRLIHRESWWRELDSLMRNEQIAKPPARGTKSRR